MPSAAGAAVHEGRISRLNSKPQNQDGTCVVYWMSRDQRPTHNWALMRAIELANQHNVPVVVIFVLAAGLRTSHLQARHQDFMVRGLAETAASLRKQSIGFLMRGGDMVKEVLGAVSELEPVAVVTDQCYLKSGQRWRRRVAAATGIAIEAVDANTIVPPSVAAEKQQFGAYTLRPKLRKLLDEYMTEYPEIEPTVAWSRDLDGLLDQDPDSILGKLKLKRDAGPVRLKPGPGAAQQALEYFIEDGIADYDKRNDPGLDATSKMSAYLHFGQISAQQIAYDLQNSPAVERHSSIVEEYLDELITWRELAVNYCMYHNSYNRLSGAPDWARKSLADHAGDEREHLYTYEQLRDGTTGDTLWNAAQHEMLKSGRMHGYMRMYWGKKILEWTDTPQTAVDYAIRLNDTYELDGRDPNGYAGVLWAIGGLHDRAWFERDVFGKVRYMNYNGAKRKFDIQAYIDRVAGL